jgi:hypothetical protein
MCSMPVCCLFFVSWDSLKWTTADIACSVDIHRTFFDGMVIWWCFYQHIGRIFHESYANHYVIMSGCHYYTDRKNGPTAESTVFKSINHMNLDLQDSGCLDVVHILHHSTFWRTTMSTQDKMVNALTKNIAWVPEDKYDTKQWITHVDLIKGMKASPDWRHIGSEHWGHWTE